MGLPLPEAAATQTVYPSILRALQELCLLLQYVKCWLGRGGHQVAFAKCVSQSLLVPPPFALSVVMNSPLHHLVFQRLVHNRECSTPSQCRALPLPGIGVASVPDVLSSDPKAVFSS